MHQPKTPRHNLKCILLPGNKLVQPQDDANDAMFNELKAGFRKTGFPLVDDSNSAAGKSCSVNFIAARN
jgi:hypothetical protein